MDARVSILAIISIIIIDNNPKLCLVVKIEHKSKSSKSEIIQNRVLSVLLEVSEFLLGVAQASQRSREPFGPKLKFDVC